MQKKPIVKIVKEETKIRTSKISKFYKFYKIKSFFTLGVEWWS